MRSDGVVWMWLWGADLVRVVAARLRHPLQQDGLHHGQDQVQGDRAGRARLRGHQVSRVGVQS